MQQIRRKKTEARKWHNIKKEPFLIAILWFTWPIFAAWILCDWFLENVVRGKFSWHGMFEFSSEQECIPLGCVPRTAVAVGGGWVCLSACWDRPPMGVGLETPPGQTPQLPPWMWAWRPPTARPLNFPPGCGSGNLQGMLGYHPPYCNACWDTTPSVDRILDTCYWKYYLAPNFVCGR